MAFYSLAGALVLTMPLAMSWMICIMAGLCIALFSGPPQRIDMRLPGREARLFYALLALFLGWLLLRTGTSPNFSDAIFAAAGFAAAFTSALICCAVIARYWPTGTWRWGAFPVINILFAAALAIILLTVMYMLGVRAPTMRHQNPYHYNRGAVFITLLLPLSWYAIGRMQLAGRAALLLRALTIVAVLIGVGISESETAKLVLIIIGPAYAIARYWPRLARLGAIVAFAAVVLAGPVIVEALFDHVRSTPVLWDFRPGTFAERVLVWKSQIDIIRKAPLLGNGIEYYRTYGSVHPLNGTLFTHLHAHSFIMQVWVDLGLVGAVLLVGLLAAAVRLTGLFGPPEAAMLLTTMIAIIAVWAVSHGMWQPWYIGISGLIVSVALLAARRAALEDSRLAG